MFRSPATNQQYFVKKINQQPPISLSQNKLASTVNDLPLTGRTTIFFTLILA
jgi:hypothetical protein